MGDSPDLIQLEIFPDHGLGPGDCLFGMIFFLIYSSEYFLTSWRQAEIAVGAWNPPLYPFKAVLPLSAALLLLQGVSELLKSIHAARRGEWL